jgi:uncharacterized protein YeaO (DUF488 family)
LRDLAPSLELSTQFSRGLVNWEDFVLWYHRELDRDRGFFKDLQDHNHNGSLTLVHGSCNADHNPAVALKMLLEKDEMAAGSRSPGEGADISRDRTSQNGS